MRLLLFFRFKSILVRNFPAAVPRYRKDTRKTGEMSPIRILESGVLIPNNVAARNAYPAGDHKIFTTPPSPFPFSGMSGVQSGGTTGTRVTSTLSMRLPSMSTTSYRSPPTSI